VKMKRRKVLMTVVVLITAIRSGVLQGQPNRRSDGSAPLEVEVTVGTRGKNDYVLHVKVRSGYQDPISVNKSDLPWENRYSMIVVAVGARSVGGVTLREVYPISDPVPSEIAIRPGEVLEGDVVLRDRFPTLPEELRKRDVVVFWSYQLPFRSGKTVSNRASGYLVIPKHDE